MAHLSKGIGLGDSGVFTPYHIKVFSMGKVESESCISWYIFFECSF